MIRSWLNSFMTWFFFFFFLNHDPIWFWNKYISIYMIEWISYSWASGLILNHFLGFFQGRRVRKSKIDPPSTHTILFLISSTVNIVIICSLFLQRLFIGSIHFQSCMITYRSTYARLKFKTCEPEKACNEKSNKR